MKIVSWNVNGIRAQQKKDFPMFIEKLDADVFMFQETKATIEIVQNIGKEFQPYSVYANEAEKKGYSGTAIFSKEEVISESYSMGIDEHDTEGRLNVLEYEHFYLVNVYVPNSGSGLKRLDYRKTWDNDFLAFCNSLRKKKGVIIGGDLNVAHTALDLARPKENYNKTSGYTQTEIDGLNAFINDGYIDSFRLLNPNKQVYTFWNMRFGARARNVGWRIDYFLLSPELKKHLKNAEILTDVLGSDHCPISVELTF